MTIRVALLLISISLPAYSQVSIKAAGKMAEQINILAEGSETIVLPTDKSDAVIVASTIALPSEKTLKFWGLISAGVVANYFKDNPSVSVDEIWLTDRASMKANPARYSVLKMSVAKEIHSELEGGMIDPQIGMDKIWRSLEQKTVAQE